jgi:hypothetical protein
MTPKISDDNIIIYLLSEKIQEEFYNIKKIVTISALGG